VDYAFDKNHAMPNTSETEEVQTPADDLARQVENLEEMIEVAEKLQSVEDGVIWIRKLKSALKRIHQLKNDLRTTIRSGTEKKPAHKNRILVKKGVEFQSLPAADVAFIFTENKLVFVVDKDSRKFLAHAGNLCDLMLQLDSRTFYRANRKYIININYIKKFRTLERVKVEVELALQSPEFIVISQENAGSFKHWIENL
jgi:DNA-binding LytR/AlgR family response regulator